MKVQYMDVSAKPAAGGIDSYSSRSKIPEGFVEDALNMDVDATGKWIKRLGHETSYGWLPLRARRFVQEGTSIRIYFDSNQVVNLSTVNLGPLIIYGKLPQLGSYGTSSFSDEENVVYFPSFSLINKDMLSAPSGTLTKDASETEIESKYVYVTLAQSTSSGNTSNEAIIPSLVQVNTSTFDISIGYVINSSASAYTLFKEKQASAGSVYVGAVANTALTVTASNSGGDLLLTAASNTFVADDVVRFTTTGSLPGNIVADTNYYVVSPTATTFKISTTPSGSPVAYSSAGTGTNTATRLNETFTFDAATHGLTITGLECRVFTESGGVATEIIPDLIYLTTDSTIGIRVFGLVSGYAIMSTTPSANISAVAAVAGDNTITIPNPPSPFCFYYVYYFNAAQSRFEKVIPGLVSYDADSDSTSITYTLAAGSESVQVFWEEADTIANVIQLEDAGSATIDTEEASIVVWGLGHRNIYSEEAARGGFIHHLDNYRSVGEEHLVTGVNGCLYYQSAYEDTSTFWLYPALYPNLSSRVDGEVVVSPLFSIEDEGRTRGNVIDASIESYKALVTGISYVSSGVMDVTLSFTNKTGAIAIGSTVSTLDELTIEGMADDRNNGSFEILSVESDDATSAVIRVSNPSALDTTINEAGAQGRAGVFTDVVPFTSSHKFIPGDVLLNESLPDNYTLSVLSLPSTSSVMVGGVELPVILATNGLVFVQREGRLIPLKDGEGVAGVENIVTGDSASLSFVAQKPVVKNVNTSSDAAVTISTVSGLTTVTFSGNHTLNESGWVCLYGDTSNTYNGEWLINSVPDTNQISILTPDIADGAGSATVLGKCIELDEELVWEDGVNASPITITGRWLPIEAPGRDGSLVIKDTTPLLLDANSYSDQPLDSSVVVADSMLLSNGDDVVYKYDGASVYKAGLARTIPSVFMALDTSVPSILKGFEVGYTAVSVAGKYFSIESDAFKVGDRVYDSQTESIFTVVEKRLVPGSPDSWNIVVAEDTSALTGTGTLTFVKRRRYYIRFNLIDINNNIIASNAANSSDMFFDIVEDGRIKIKTSYYLIQGFQDYSRLEVEIYCTLSNTLAPFYLTKRLSVPVDFTGNVSLEIIDDNDDQFLTELDTVNSGLLGTEIGIGWQPPYRAKHLTTIDNKLLIANIKSWPKLDITMKAKNAAATVADLNSFSLLFKKDNTDASTTPNFVDRVGFQFSNANVSGIGEAFTLGLTPADVNTATDEITKVGADMVNGTAIKIVGSDVPAPLVSGTVYYANRISNSVFRVSTTQANAFNGVYINLTSTGSGTFDLISAGEIYDGTIIRGSNYSTGDWVYLYYGTKVDNPSLAYCGWFQVEKQADDTAVLLGWGKGEQEFGEPIPNIIVHGQNGNIPVWIGTDYNYNQVNGNSSGSVELIAARRLADAINFTMSYNQYLDKELYPDFEPWLTAYAGGDYGVGQVVVECQLTLTSTPELKIGTIPTGLSIFVNNLGRSSDEEISASTFLYPSRIGISYRNYPELFDNLDGQRSNSDSVVDINPADGQEITKVVPFFGESTFGGAQLNQVVLVAKANSWYVLDVATREYQKLDTRGVGCTSPFTVTSGKDGVMFVNRGGIYRITRSFTLQYVGKLMEGKWKSLINRDGLEVACATHWGLERKYKVSLPLAGQTTNDAVFTYTYDREEEGLPGAWTRYNNHDATLWCNQREGNFFGSTEGVVFKIRQYGEAIDYRDDTSSIASELLFRAEDFGLPGVRKTVPAAVVQLDAEVDLTDIVILSALNLSTSYENIGTVEVDASSSPVIKCSVANKKGTHLQIKLTHDVIDEYLAITGLNFTVGRMDVRGVSQAANFRGGNS